MERLSPVYSRGIEPRRNYFFPVSAAVEPPEVVVVELEVTVDLPVPFGFSSGPQPTNMPNANSEANTKIFFIIHLKSSVFYVYSPEPFRRSYLRSRGLGFYSRLSYNFFQIRQSAG